MKTIEDILHIVVRMDLEGATRFLECNGWKWRVTRRDGKPAIVTRDYRRDRVGLVVEGEVVVDAEVG